MECEHKWIYQGVVYWPGEYALPGSGAHPMKYGDKYYCEKCLETAIKNERTVGNTYQNPLSGTLPR